MEKEPLIIDWTNIGSLSKEQMAADMQRILDRVESKPSLELIEGGRHDE